MQRNRAGELKFYKLFGLCSIVLLLGVASAPLNAETFTEFKNKQSVTFQEFRDENDRAFSQYLKAEWEAYTAQKPEVLYEHSKPKQISPATSQKIKSVGPRLNVKLSLEKPSSEKTLPKVANGFVNKDVSFDFFGTTVGFAISDEVKTAKFYPQAQEGISNFFKKVASTDYAYLIEDIHTIIKSMGLNDWGTYLLVTKLSHELYSNVDEAELFNWFIFNKLGYSVRVGLVQKNIVLMFQSDKVIYATPNYTIDGKQFYVLADYLKSGMGRIYTYKQNYPDADKVFDLSLTTLPNLVQNSVTKTIGYKKYGNEYSVTYNYNQNLLDFMATYPQADYETFFNAPMEAKTYTDIAKGLKKYIQGKQASEAIDFVLKFVQNAFIYQTDAEQFGHEKVMFAEETLYYEKSDCEDRSVLFAYLMKELFGIGVIGIKYKDHMATGLYIPMKGDTVTLGSRRFVIADPTYVNANIGQSMPKYKPLKPERFIVVHSARKSV